MTGGTAAFRATVLGATLDDLGRVTAERDALRAALVRYGIQREPVGAGYLYRCGGCGAVWCDMPPDSRGHVPGCALLMLAQPGTADGDSGG